MESTSFWNPESTVLESGIRNPQHGIQNPRLSWIPLHGATCWSLTKIKPHFCLFRRGTETAELLHSYGLEENLLHAMC